MEHNRQIRLPQFSDLLRHLLLAWLVAVLAEYLLLAPAQRSLEGLESLQAMSLGRILLITGLAATALTLLDLKFRFRLLQRIAMAGCFLTLTVLTLKASFNLVYALFCAAVAAVFIIYAIRGWNAKKPVTAPAKGRARLWLWLTVGAAAAFFLFISVLTVCRVLTFQAPNFDFGIFSQMFHSMKTTGLPMTTVERDGLLSHFHVHVSPIYYLMLPFYCIWPRPETLQVLQAAVMASAAIPLWKIGKLHGLKGPTRFLLCLMLFLAPAFGGGACYDIHENCFLTPLLLWLFYGLDRKNLPVALIAALLTLMVKEDAAVYVAVVGLFALVQGALTKQPGQMCMGSGLLAGAIVWFLLVTSYLSNVGDGVMTYRYSNLIYDGSGSLFTVIKAVLINPMKVLFECATEQKLKFALQMLLPMAFLPFFTRRYERFVLLIPFVLINLISDYQYQHNMSFQYQFGSIAFLIYLSAINLAELRLEVRRLAAATAGVLMGMTLFCATLVPQQRTYVQTWQNFGHIYQQMRQTLDQIPEDASVACGTFLVPHLSQRDILYDVRYCSTEHLLSVEYVALDLRYESDLRNYASSDKTGLEGIQALLAQNHFVPFAELDGRILIYQKLTPTA